MLFQRQLSRAFLSAALALLLISVSSGQDADSEEFGFLEMVNLISLDSPTYFTFGSYKIAGGDPLSPGGSSGYTTIKANSYAFTVSNAGAKPKEVGERSKLKKAGIRKPSSMTRYRNLKTKQKSTNYATQF
jgi:hypothetical protein